MQREVHGDEVGARWRHRHACRVAHMGLHGTDAMVQVQGCGALRNVAAGDAVCKRAVIQCEGTEAVVAAMRAHPEQAMVTQNCCGMLWNNSICWPRLLGKRKCSLASSSATGTVAA